MAKKKETLTISLVSVIVLSLILFFTCIGSITYTLSETEVAIVTTFGVPKIDDVKGLRFKLPYIQHVEKVDTTIRGFELGYRSNSDGSTYTVEDESLMITSDLNFIDVDFYITYRVSDPIKFVYNSQNPEAILRDLAQTCIRSTVSAYTVDSVLTTGKSEIQANIKQIMTNELELLDLGIILDDISIQDAEPPTQAIQEAFKAVETAKQDKESTINKANQYRNEQLPLANATADKTLQQAEATKQARINEATGAVAYYNSLYEEFKKYPLITKERMFYEAMEELLPNLKVIIDDGNGNLTNVLIGENFSTTGGGQ